MSKMMADLSFDLVACTSTMLDMEPALSFPSQRHTTLERRVIEIGLGDGPETLAPPTRFQKFARWLFGGSHPNALANPELEKLRQAVVRARVKDRATEG